MHSLFGKSEVLFRFLFRPIQKPNVSPHYDVASSVPSHKLEEQIIVALLLPVSKLTRRYKKKNKLV